jgi:hypothetical protein
LCDGYFHISLIVMTFLKNSMTKVLILSLKNKLSIKVNFNYFAEIV